MSERPLSEEIRNFLPPMWDKGMIYRDDLRRWADAVKAQQQVDAAREDRLEAENARLRSLLHTFFYTQDEKEYQRVELELIQEATKNDS